MFVNRLRKLVRHLAPVAFCLVMILTVLTAIPSISEASGTTAGLPWETPLATLAKSMSGPVAFAVSIIMVIIGVAVLAFGGDLQGWARWVAFAIIAVGTLAGATTFVNYLGLDGALIV